MATKVQASIVNDLIKKISDFLFKGLDKLIDMGCEVNQVKQDKDGVLTFQIRTGGDKLLDVICKPVESDSKEKIFDVTIKEKHGGKSTTKKNISEKQFDDLFTDIIDSWYGESYEGIDDEEDVESSITVTLQKVTSSTGYDVKLKNISASVDMAKYAADMCNAIMSDDDFIEALPEEATYEVVPIDDDDSKSVEVEELNESCDEAACEYETYACIIAYCQKMINHLKAISWNAKEDPSHAITMICDSVKWDLECLQNCIASLSVTTFGYAPDPTALCKDIDCISVEYGFTPNDAICTLSQDIQEILDILEMFICNVPMYAHDVISQYILTFTKTKCDWERNYTV